MKRQLVTVLTCIALAIPLAVFAAGKTPATAQTSVAPTSMKAAATTAKPAAAKPADNSMMSGTMAKMPMCDINTASKADLMKIPGVGDVTAGKIIAGRPFANKAQLVSKGIMTKAQYDKGASCMIAKAATPTASKTKKVAK